jgi:DNA repair protein RadC
MRRNKLNKAAHYTKQAFKWLSRRICLSIKDWPKSQRPREKLINQGAFSLTDAELLAIFLRTGSKGLDAVSLAQQLIDSFGGLKGLLQADKTTFCQGLGLGEAKYSQLQAVLEMARRHHHEALADGVTLNGSSLVKEYVSHQLKAYQREVFACLFLDNGHRLLAFEELFYGTLTEASVYPREVVKSALKHNAAAVIFAHNHPSSGSSMPSASDRLLTTRLIEALSLVDIKVLDHCIVGDQKVGSFAELGYL